MKENSTTRKTSEYLKSKQRQENSKKLLIYETLLTRAQNPFVSKHIQVLSKTILKLNTKAQTILDSKLNPSTPSIKEDQEDIILGPASLKLYESIRKERDFDAYGRIVLHKRR